VQGSPEQLLAVKTTGGVAPSCSCSVPCQFSNAAFDALAAARTNVLSNSGRSSFRIVDSPLIERMLRLPRAPAR
jgi:hypothetical protein